VTTGQLGSGYERLGAFGETSDGSKADDIVAAKADAGKTGN